MLKYAPLTRSYLTDFLKNLRKEDLEELKYHFKEEFEEKFIDLCLQNEKYSYLLVDDNNLPVALGGVVKIDCSGLKIGQIWLLSTKNFYKYKKSVLSCVLDKISKFKQEYDFLYNYIYFTNFNSDAWLKKVGFKFVELKNEKFKLFYFTNKKGEKIDIRRFTCK